MSSFLALASSWKMLAVESWGPSLRKPVAMSLSASRRRAGAIEHLVSGELLPDELVVGPVLVEGPDDVVAVAVHVGTELVPLVSVRVCVADDVEPVPRPVLAVARTREEALDESLVGARKSIGKEGIDFRRRGGQPRDPEGQAADRAYGGPPRGRAGGPPSRARQGQSGR